jgi:putative membrane protein
MLKFISKRARDQKINYEKTNRGLSMQNYTDTNRESSLWKGLVAGVVSGLVASWAMNQFQAAWQKAVEGEERGHGAQSMQKGSPSAGIAEELKEQGIEEPEDDAPERLAKYIALESTGHQLTKSEKEAGGTVLHYAFGVSTGALYGIAAEIIPEVTIGAGLPFGTAVWVGADEIVTPLLGLSKSGTEYPASIHAYALSSHLVYGLTAEIMRRTIRNIL